ncbi:diacylglycerol/lipid kinase family protein [Vagococcus zengguangii]|uniref:Diacylglycerol kinase family lipid kinase n=1 Tax=Vagococcus zengguangii TaxID=2571750 RepID=A0A4D7CU46_9ENTE|nr:diacylglycerol kinase family protein [Vagococcus zengguangii]QCI86813.1 diacylglycerol kinase family lipid kinase [Vagococcus zengguangii]TLG80419.1 diacylglycerol kinase family lipid kinase [Vagococcus zengguangii]
MHSLHLHIIANENAGSGNGMHSLQQVKNYLIEHNLPYTIHLSEYAGHAIELAQTLAQSTLKPWHEASDVNSSPFPLLVALGGDGTVFEIQNGLSEFPLIPFGYIPSGSGNDFARSADIPREPIEALKQLLASTAPTSIYSLLYQENTTNETYLISNNLGIGLDAAIVAKANESQNKTTLNKLKLGSLAYLFSMIGLLFKQKGYPLTVDDGQQQKKFKKAFLATSSKHPYFGGGVKILPNASLYEPELELIVVEKISYLKIASLLLKLTKGTHVDSPYAHIFRSKELNLYTETKQYGQMNGEAITPRPFKVNLTSVERLLWK